MPCENYKDALIEAAASGAMPQGDLRAHLAECVSCRAVLAEEQSLFATIDSGLRIVANAEVPASLLPRVRVGLDEALSPRSSLASSFVFASAGAALLLLVFLMARPYRSTPGNVAKQEPVVVPAPVAPGANASPAKTSPPGTQIAAVRVNQPRATRNSTGAHTAASSTPEVLVPPDEREGLTRLIAALNEHRDFAAALVVRSPEKKHAVVTVDPLLIADIEIKPLEVRETETSDGAGEKR